MNKRSKRDIAVKARNIIVLLIVLVAILEIVVSGTEEYESIVRIVTKILFSAFCGIYGYILGWDDNTKPSTLKGP